MSGADGADVRRSCIFSAPHRGQVEPFIPAGRGQSPVLPLKEGVMRGWNFSSNADWLVAVLLAVTVVAAFV